MNVYHAKNNVTPMLSDMAAAQKQSFERWFSKISVKEGYHKLPAAELSQKKRQYEEIYAQHWNMGRSLERQRIKAIYDLLPNWPMHKDMIWKAMFTADMTVQDVSMRIVQIEKTKGIR